MPDQFSGQLSGLAEGAFHGSAVFFLDTKGDDIASEIQWRHDVLMASNFSACYMVMEPAHALHGFAAFMLFGVVQRYFDTITGFEPQQSKQVTGLQLQDYCGVPAVNVDKVVKSAAVGLAARVQPAIQISDGAPSPGKRDKQYQSSEVLEVVPVETFAQGIKEGLDFFWELDDLKHIGNLLSNRLFNNCYIEETAVFC